MVALMAAAFILTGAAGYRQHMQMLPKPAFLPHWTRQGRLAAIDYQQSRSAATVSGSIAASTPMANPAHQHYRFSPLTAVAAAWSCLLSEAD